VKGATLMRGYYKVAPEQVFDADGYFRTQDGGSLDAQGALHWTGRLSNLIKTGGANVSPSRSGAARDATPGLRLGIPGRDRTPDARRGARPLRGRGGGREVDEESLRAWLRERLAAYKVPRRVLFFRADELAYTAIRRCRSRRCARRRYAGCARSARRSRATATSLEARRSSRRQKAAQRRDSTGWPPLVRVATHRSSRGPATPISYRNTHERARPPDR
jgi:acyl-CoA synthetase (AMP-forming)/AMP-acid ligase II